MKKPILAGLLIIAVFLAHSCSGRANAPTVGADITPVATIAHVAFGQNGQDIGQAVVQAGKDRYLAAGYTDSFGVGGKDVYLVMVDSTGDCVWTKTFGSEGDDIVYAMKNDGNKFILAGATNYTDENGVYKMGKTIKNNDVNPDGTSKTAMSKGDQALLVETDAKGNTLWYKTYGGNGNEVANALAVTKDGYVLAGQSTSFGKNNMMYLIKTDKSGNKLWEKTYGGTEKNSCVYSIINTPDEGLMVAGYVWSTVTASNDACLIKLDAAGNVVFQRTFGGPMEEIAYSVDNVIDGGYVFAGSTNTYGMGGKDIYMVKVDSKGDCVWARTYGGTNIDVAYNIITTKEGLFLMSGYTASFGQENFYLVKTDKMGLRPMERKYGGTNYEEARCTVEGDDGTFISVGFSNSFGPTYDFYMTATDKIGKLLW